MWYRAVGCIVTLILSLPVTPPVAQAQQLSRVPRVRVLEERSPTALFLAAFRQGLRELGYTERGAQRHRVPVCARSYRPNPHTGSNSSA